MKHKIISSLKCENLIVNCYINDRFSYRYLFCQLFWHSQEPNHQEVHIYHHNREINSTMHLRTSMDLQVTVTDSRRSHREQTMDHHRTHHEQIMQHLSNQNLSMDLHHSNLSNHSMHSHHMIFHLNKILETISNSQLLQPLMVHQLSPMVHHQTLTLTAIQLVEMAMEMVKEDMKSQQNMNSNMTFKMHLLD